MGFKKHYNIPENYKIIGTASYIYPPKFYENKGLKGHEELLEAFREILKVRKDVILVIAGSTFGENKTYENKLVEMGKAIDEKEFLQENIPTFTALLLILMSLYTCPNQRI